MDKIWDLSLWLRPVLFTIAPDFQINHGSIKSTLTQKQFTWLKIKIYIPLDLIPPPTNSGIFEAFLVIPEPTKNGSSSWWVTGILGGGRSNGFSNNRMETSKLFFEIWMFPKIGVPQNGCVIIYNGKNYWNGWSKGVPPFLGNTHILNSNFVSAASRGARIMEVTLSSFSRWGIAS